MLAPTFLLGAGGAPLGLVALAGPHTSTHSRSVTTAAAPAARGVTIALAANGTPEDVGVVEHLPSTDQLATFTRAQAAASRSRRIALRKAELAKPDFVRPGVGVLTSPFGFRGGRLHAGIDLAGPWGSPVRAVTDGVVTFAGQESGYGNFITVEHSDGTVSAYGHLSKILVSVGEKVGAGDEIGHEGSTGHSTGPHLHFEIRLDGKTPVNPIPWLQEHGITV